MNQHKINEWFNDNFENISDDMENYKINIIPAINKKYDVVFTDDISYEGMEILIESIIEDCSKSIGESYEDCNNILRHKLEKLWNLK